VTLKQILRHLQKRNLKNGLARKYSSRSISEIHNYWRKPWDNMNNPNDYVSEKCIPRSLYLLNLVENWVLAHIITEHDDLKTPANSIGDQ
jgi:hypothetical protein